MNKLKKIKKVVMISHMGVEKEQPQENFFMFKNFFNKGNRLPVSITQNEAPFKMVGTY